MLAVTKVGAQAIKWTLRTASAEFWGFDPDLAGELLRSPSTAEHGEIDC